MFRVSLVCILLSLSTIFADDANRIVVLIDESGAASVEVVSSIPVWCSDRTVAYAKYQDMATSADGWGTLSVHTNPFFNDDAIASYAAGYAEAYLTAERIFQHNNNVSPRSTLSAAVLSYFDANSDFLSSSVNSSSSISDYWYQVKIIMNQLDGLTDGYNASPCVTSGSCSTLDRFDMLLLQNHGDLEDIIPALSMGNITPELSLAGSGSCSALIRLLPDYSDLYVSHVTWTGYQTMIRIWKQYNFAFKTGSASTDLSPGNRVVFSSYPGMMLSGDDYYVTSPAKLIIMETTIGYSKQELNKFILPNLVPDWIRNIVANRLSSSGREWTTLFAQYNSGTYNNEWMVVDLKLFSPGSAPPVSDLVWMLDQIPGLTESADRTSLLASQLYIPSYNIASFPNVFNVSGGEEAEKNGGDWYSYSHSPRALIFSRDASSVTSVESMQKLMRYNKFQSDPLSKCDCVPLGASGENAISARSDLNPQNGTYPFAALSNRAHGGTDAKLTAASAVLSGVGSRTLPTYIVNGPTHDDQPVFQWSTSSFKDDVKHEGQPDAFDFDWAIREFTDN